jgi:hypothetical protein
MTLACYFRSRRYGRWMKAVDVDYTSLGSRPEIRSDKHPISSLACHGQVTFRMVDQPDGTKNNPLRHSGLYSGPTNARFVGDHTLSSRNVAAAR